MRVILAIDAIEPHLTGIGRYAWELASRLQSHPDIECLSFYAPGRWIDAVASPPLQPAQLCPKPRRMAWPRSLQNWRHSRKAQGRVFHSPNYFLPAFIDSGIATIHDLSVLRFPQTHPAARVKQFERDFAPTLKRASHLITDSKAIRDEVIDLFGWPAEKIAVIPLGVSNLFRPRSMADVRATFPGTEEVAGRYVLCVSTLEPRKGVDRLLQAYSALAAQLRYAFPLVIAGGKGWLNCEIHSRIEKAQSEGWVKYLGYVDESELPALYAGARAFVYPSIYEGFGLPVLEAMASGVPVLTSNCSSLPELSERAALLVDTLDIDALKMGIERVVLDEPWRAAACKSGIEIARGYSWERCVDRTVDVYRKI
jgi:alpha-1,3-rhamnosyl/mannosyltransferase